jgi:hypothetical protein
MPLGFALVPTAGGSPTAAPLAPTVWILEGSACDRSTTPVEQQYHLAQWRPLGSDLWGGYARVAQVSLVPDTCFFALDAVTDASTGQVTLYATADDMVYAYIPARQQGFVLASAPAWRAFLGGALVQLPLPTPPPDSQTGSGQAAAPSQSAAALGGAIGGGIAAAAVLALGAYAWHAFLRRAARVHVYRSAAAAAGAVGGRGGRAGGAEFKRGASERGAAALGLAAPLGGGARPRTSVAGPSEVGFIMPDGTVVGRAGTSGLPAGRGGRSSLTNAMAAAAAVQFRQQVEAEQVKQSAAAYMTAVYAARKMQRRAEHHRRASDSAAPRPHAGGGGGGGPGGQHKAHPSRRDIGYAAGADPRGMVSDVADADAALHAKAVPAAAGTWHDEERGEAVLRGLEPRLYAAAAAASERPGGGAGVQADAGQRRSRASTAGAGGAYTVAEAAAAGAWPGRPPQHGGFSPGVGARGGAPGAQALLGPLSSPSLRAHARETGATMTATLSVANVTRGDSAAAGLPVLRLSDHGGDERAPGDGGYRDGAAVRVRIG